MNIVAPILILGGLGLFFGTILAVSARVFHVEQDERIDKVNAILPGANCGACSYPGCGGLAVAIVKGQAPANSCPVGGTETALAVAAVMGINAEEIVRYVAYINCRGGQHAKRKFEYDGVTDCLAASGVAGGPLQCAHGCMGLGSCVQACQYGAIRIEDGVAVVNPDRCVSCKVCIATCPRQLISMVNDKQNVFVGCSSTERSSPVRKACDIGCISCTLCTKQCPTGAITIKDNLAVIDYDKCDNCGHCASVCPRKLITEKNQQSSCRE